jgi:hypothetical protein
LRSAVTGYFILAELVAHNERRSGALLEYTAVKRHQVIDSRGEMYAEEIAHIEHHAPDKKTFVVTSERGWGPIGHFTLDQLIASEIEAAAGGDDGDNHITPVNYKVDPLGEQQVGTFHCFVVQAIPKRKEKHLFEGRICDRSHRRPSREETFFLDSKRRVCASGPGDRRILAPTKG